MILVVCGLFPRTKNMQRHLIAQQRWKQFTRKAVEGGTCVVLEAGSKEWLAERKKAFLNGSIFAVLFNCAYRSKRKISLEKVTGIEEVPSGIVKNLMDTGRAEEPIIFDKFLSEMKGCLKPQKEKEIFYSRKGGIFKLPLDETCKEIYRDKVAFDAKNLHSAACPDGVFAIFSRVPFQKLNLNEFFFTLEIKFRSSGNDFVDTMSPNHFVQLYATCMHVGTKYGVYIQKRVDNDGEKPVDVYRYRIIQRTAEFDQLILERRREFYFHLLGLVDPQEEKARFPVERALVMKHYKKALLFSGESQGTLKPLCNELLRKVEGFGVNSFKEVEKEMIYLTDSDSESCLDSSGWTEVFDEKGFELDLTEDDALPIPLSPRKNLKRLNEKALEKRKRRKQTK
jgi:hypothetical protein